jgi:hypothetical protein
LASNTVARICRSQAPIAILTLATGVLQPAQARELSLREKLTVLQVVYRDHVEAIDETHVTMKDGLKIAIDDGRQKAHAEKLADADIEDMLSQVYPVGGCAAAGVKPARDFDPGRIRNEAFFKSVYGATAKQVAAQLRPLNWFGQNLQVARTLAVDKKLTAVRDELTPASQALRKFLTPSDGTFNWRLIAGTAQRSTHSYGIAIDIAAKNAEYWRWSKSPAPRSKIPDDIVAAFERHGFIWGGRWHHFDTMHFEYRPELIAIGQLARLGDCQ